jgi:hypothetical protein
VSVSLNIVDASLCNPVEIYMRQKLLLFTSYALFVAITTLICRMRTYGESVVERPSGLKIATGYKISILCFLTLPRDSLNPFDDTLGFKTTA